jgi:hypothetical protein
MMNMPSSINAALTALLLLTTPAPAVASFVSDSDFESSGIRDFDDEGARTDAGLDWEFGAHIWLGEDWGWFRAHIGPRWRASIFSIRPHAALGPSFFTGIGGQPMSLGAYVDLDVSIPAGPGRSIDIGPGGGIGYVLGLEHITGGVIPQGYLQAAYRWSGNIVGLMALMGPRYDWERGPDRIRFTGVGLRFEYVISSSRQGH